MRWSRWSHLVAHIRRWADISHITSQTVLGRLGYSCWWLVACYVCEVLQYGICHRYYHYVTAEWRWRPEWVGVQYHARTHVSHVHCSPAQTAFSFTNIHRPTQRSPLDKQSRSAIIILTTVICYVTTVTSDNWPLRCCLKVPTPPANDHPHRWLPRWRGWSSAAAGEGSDFNVVARCLLYFTKSISAICWQRCSSMLRCCGFSMSDVYIGRTLYDTCYVVER